VKNEDDLWAEIRNLAEAWAYLSNADDDWLECVRQEWERG